MLDFLMLVLFCWLFFKVLGLTFRVAWGVTKVAAAVLFAMAVPAMVLCLLFAGGILLAVPLGMLALAFGLLKRAV